MGDIIDVDYYESMESRQMMRQSQPLPVNAVQSDVSKPLMIEATRTWNEMTGGLLQPSDVYSINKAMVKTLERFDQLPSMLKATQKKKKSKKAKKAASNDQEQKTSAKSGQRRS